MIKIGDKVDISNGYAFKSSKYVEQGIRVVRITNVQKGEIQDDNPKFYSSDTKEELKSYLINEGDILMSLTGNVGRVGVFPKEFCPAYLNQRVARIRVKSQDLFQKYLFYMLNSEFFERDAIFNSSGIAQLNLSTKWVSEYKIPLPPLEQQKKIAAILDAADAYRQKTKALITKYDELTQSLFLDMFGDPVRNPKGWKKVPLKDVIVKIGRGKSPKYSEYETGFWAINQKCIQWGVINPIHKKPILESFFLDLKNEFKAKKDDVLVNSTGTGTLGRSSVYNLETDDMIDSHVTIVRPILGDVKSIFLSVFFNQKNIQSEIYRTSVTGSTNQIELNKESFSKFQIYLPDLSIQNQFAERVQAIEAQKAQAQASLVQAEDLFNSLLQRAFKGELTN